MQGHECDSHVGITEFERQGRGSTSCIACVKRHVRWLAEKGSANVDTLRVLIAEDHPMFRDGLRALLGSMPDCEVVGEAETGTAAVEQALALQPDVVVMDLDLPGLDGVRATRQIVSTSPHIGVLVLTMFDDDDSVFAAMRAGRTRVPPQGRQSGRDPAGGRGGRQRRGHLRSAHRRPADGLPHRAPPAGSYGCLPGLDRP